MVAIVSALFLAAFAAPVALGTPIIARSYDYAVRDTHRVPTSWTKLGRAPSDHIIRLQIGLTQTRFGELERHLYEVSDPDHPRYRQHLSQSEVHDIITPSDEALEATHSWLADHGIHSDALQYSPARDWITVTLPVANAERLLDTEYSVFRHEDGTRLVRTPEWSLPLHLHEYIDAVQPTNSFFRAMPRSSSLRYVKTVEEGVTLQEMPLGTDLTINKACGDFSMVTPTCLRTLYGTANYTVQCEEKKKGKCGDKQSKVALNDFLQETNNRSDTRLFLQKYRPDAVSEADSFKFYVVNGGNTNQAQETPAELAMGRELEGNLDSETIIGITYPIPLFAYTTGGSPPFKADKFSPTDTNEPYLTWLQFILAQGDDVIPQTISTSYADDEQTVPLSYAKKVCNDLAQLGARGVTAFFGSGDEGVGGNGTCFSNDGKNTREFIASFPSTCPFITSVGATKNYPPVAAYDPRNGFTSGGGFSNYFARPAYQDKAVAKYISELGNRYSNLYNASGRGYPDLSAQGQSFITVWNGTGVLLDGTSASTPTVASVFALINDALLAQGSRPLGLVNPFIYSRGMPGFTDVTSGSAAGCSGMGFPALKGWDPVTGLGTPIFPQLRTLVGA